MAGVAFFLASALAHKLWNENFGDKHSNLKDNILGSVSAMMADARIPLLGLTQAVFETSMFAFIFLWSPSIQEAADLNHPGSEPPFGIIFSNFMVAIMIGSVAFSAWTFIGAELVILFYLILTLSSVAMFMAWQSHGSEVLYTFSFLLFEICCGIYYPASATMRGQIIPENLRASVTNVFRVPLNLMVIVMLIKVRERDPRERAFFVESFLLTDFYDLSGERDGKRDCVFDVRFLSFTLQRVCLCIAKDTTKEVDRFSGKDVKFPFLIYFQPID